MPLKLRDPGAVPGEQWQFPVAATGHTCFGPNWHGLLWEIEKHCKANNVAIPATQEVIDWCCNNLGVGCYDDVSRQPLVNRFQIGLPVKLPNRSCCTEEAK
jgi:hypothetical protein